MSKAQLKKQLNSLEKSQIIEMVIELYDARKEAKEYLEFYLNPDEDKKLEEFKKIIQKSSTLPVGSPKLASAFAVRR